MFSIVAFRRMMTMSRKDVNGSNRCPICGGKMRLVNVTWVNTFRTPEANQYDLSVSNRKAMLGNAAMSSSHEMMCSNCCRRSPVENPNAKDVKKAKRAAKKAAKAERKKSHVGAIIGWIIFLIILVVTVYFVYKYRDVLNGYIAKIGELFNKAKELIGKFQK